ncbi:MAG: RecX family transcriptional regulator [Chloroflexi bacterium]|nr:MAG: RecX family transcriptional regulator [Chloroflexota bacterium]
MAARLRPGTITRIKPLGRDPEKVILEVDGQFALTLPAITVLERGLHAGVELDAAAISELATIAEAEQATSAALHFVAYRPRSEREVRDRLRRRGFTAEAVDTALSRMRGWGYIDDSAFAEFWVENRVEHAPRGRRKLEAELRTKGVEREVVNQAIEHVALRELDDALALARKRLPSLHGLDEATQRRRLSGYLARRGYDWPVVRATLEQLYGAELDEARDP